MDQTRLVSLIESMMNVFTGFFVSWAVWVLLVAPLFGFDAGYARALGITSIFTISSLMRAYVIRRWFNNSTERGAEAVGRWLKNNLRGLIQ